MTHLIPHFEFGHLFGSPMVGEGECRGISLSIQWLGLIVDMNLGRVAKRKGGAK